MDSIDFQGWVHSNIEIKPPYNKDDMWHFGAVIFGMPHTIRGNATSSGGVFYLDFGVLTPTEEEIYISSRLINQTGGYETALRVRVTEFFVSALDCDHKREVLCEYNRFFGGGVSLFLRKISNPKDMSVKDLIENLDIVTKEKEKEKKATHKPEGNKELASKLTSQIDSYTRLLKKRIHAELGIEIGENYE